MTVSSLHSTRSRRHNKGDGRRSVGYVEISKDETPKRVLALPDLEQAESAALNTLTSLSGQQTYDSGLLSPDLGAGIRQALAIRTGKIYIQTVPEIQKSDIELFLDIEGIPDQQVSYLVGLPVRDHETLTHHAFWAETKEDEESVWRMGKLHFRQCYGHSSRADPLPANHKQKSWN
jgi:hypothetical protein